MAATLAELIANVASIRKLIGVYLAVKEPNAKQRAALATDLKQLDKNLAALAAFNPATPLAPVPVVTSPKVPLFGASNKLSRLLYGPWVAEWWSKQAWASLASVEEATVAAKAAADGCLAQVTAAGKLGSPHGPYADLGDWSLYTDYPNTSSEFGWRHEVWIMGELVASEESHDPDGLPFAIANGIDPDSGATPNPEEM